MEADIEFQKAIIWYNQQKIGLGKYFSNEVAGYINILKKGNLEYRLAFQDVRCITLRQFPYLIYYYRDWEKHVVVVVGLLHQRQNRLEDR